MTPRPESTTLRDLADWLDAHPSIPAPTSIDDASSISWHGMDDAARDALFSAFDVEFSVRSAGTDDVLVMSEGRWGSLPIKAFRYADDDAKIGGSE